MGHDEQGGGSSCSSSTAWTACWTRPGRAVLRLRHRRPSATLRPPQRASPRSRQSNWVTAWNQDPKPFVCDQDRRNRSSAHSDDLSNGSRNPEHTRHRSLRLPPTMTTLQFGCGSRDLETSAQGLPTGERPPGRAAAPPASVSPSWRGLGRVPRARSTRGGPSVRAETDRLARASSQLHVSVLSKSHQGFASGQVRESGE